MAAVLRRLWRAVVSRAQPGRHGHRRQHPTPASDRASSSAVSRESCSNSVDRSTSSWGCSGSRGESTTCSSPPMSCHRMSSSPARTGTTRCPWLRRWKVNAPPRAPAAAARTRTAHHPETDRSRCRPTRAVTTGAVAPTCAVEALPREREVRAPQASPAPASSPVSDSGGSAGSSSARSAGCWPTSAWRCVRTAPRWRPPSWRVRQSSRSAPAATPTN